MKKKIKNNNNLWGGRFSESPSKTMVRINSSIKFDKILYEKDIKVSMAHVDMLYNQKIISKADLKKIISGLNKIQAELKKK